jgi:hypothetical protein
MHCGDHRMRAVVTALKNYDPREYGATTMRTVILGMVLMATVFASAWSLSHTTALTIVTPTDSPVVNPLDMMKNAGEMPVQVMVDLI